MSDLTLPKVTMRDDPGSAAKRRRLNGTPWQPTAETDPVAGPVYPPPATEIAGARQSPQTRPWHRRPVVMAPLALAVTLVAVLSLLLSQASSTLAMLQAVNPPAPVVSAAVLGGDAALQIDTSAALGALQANGSGPTRSVGLWQRLGQSVQGAAMVAGLTQATDKTTNLLLIGVDAEPGQEIDNGLPAVALGVLHLNAESGACRVLAIPLDTRTELPGYGQSRVHHGLVVGGIPYQRQVVEELLDISIDHHGLVDFTGLQELVDAMGGVTLDVPEAFVAGDVEIAAGRQTLDGEQALHYARHRAGESESARLARQQQVLRSLAQSTPTLNVTRLFSTVLPALAAHTRTDLEPTDLLSLADQARTSCTESKIELRRLGGTPGTFADPLVKTELSYLVVTDQELQQHRAWLLGS